MQGLPHRCFVRLRGKLTSKPYVHTYSTNFKLFNTLPFSRQVLLDLVRTIIAPNLNAVLKTDGYKEMQPELRMRLIHEGGSIKRRRVEVE